MYIVGDNVAVFGKIVKKYLIENDLQQNVIATNTGLTKQAVSNLLNRDNISLDKMLMIADALNCDLEINLKPREKQNID